MTTTQIAAGDIGRRIAHYRLLNGWSARRLALESGGAVTRAVIANLESGRRGDPTLGQFLAICMALRVPPVALMVDLEAPFGRSGLTFRGSAPAPFGPTDPTVAAVAWLSGRVVPGVLRSAARVAEVLYLIDIHRQAQDEFAALTMSPLSNSIRDVTGPSEIRQRWRVTDRVRAVSQQLRAAGVRPSERGRNDHQPAPS